MPCVGYIIFLESELTCQASCLSEISFQNKMLLQVSRRHGDVALEGPTPQQSAEFRLTVEIGYPVGVGNSGCLS